MEIQVPIIYAGVNGLVCYHCCFTAGAQTNVSPAARLHPRRQDHQVGG